MKVQYGKYKDMGEKKIVDLLMKEGFPVVYVWEDLPGSYYPDHTHDYYSAHVILSGEMKVKAGGKEYTFKKGDRFDVEKGEKHSAKIGPDGCKYIIGEKRPEE